MGGGVICHKRTARVKGKVCKMVVTPAMMYDLEILHLLTLL